MKHKFKWNTNNLKYIWYTDLYIKNSVLELDTLSNEEIDKINNWYRIEYINWQLYLHDDDNILYKNKKEECKNIILWYYTETDQRNTLMFWTEEERTIMADFIKEMIIEFRTNKENANYEWIEPGEII